MPSTTAAEKQALRRTCRAFARGMSHQARRESDKALFARFLALPQLADARRVLLYHGMGGEPDTARLMEPLRRMGKILALPRCLPENRLEFRIVECESGLVRHPYGMWEPGEDCPLLKENDGPDLALIPGLAFDRSGGRLGQGGGYYDRWLAGFSGVRVALCRDGLLYDELPRQEHDLGVDLVVTETGLWGPSAFSHERNGAAGPRSRSSG